MVLCLLKIRPCTCQGDTINLKTKAGMQMLPMTLLHQPKTLPVLLLLKHLSACQWKDVAFVLQHLSGERLNHFGTQKELLRWDS